MQVMVFLRRLFPLFLLALFALTGAAQAHPHVWIDARGEVLVENNAITGMRHHWTFDEYFSAWAIQGLDTDGDGVLTPEELQPLADENIVGLDYYSFYTFAETASGPVGFAGAFDPSMVFENGRTTLTFTVLFDVPQPLSRAFDIEVGDPEYYAAFSFDGSDAVTLDGAPEACLVEVSEPSPIAPELEERLFMLGPDVTELPDDLRQAARDLANLVTVRCPELSGASALEAIETAAPARPRTPFAAPPAEPGISPSEGGIMGWIGTQQRNFYQALTAALSALHADGNAFWVLGGLSFLYGVFHAAGPGHGKVIISSYVLANERQLRRGVTLSFLSALLQSLVAIGLVLVASGLLRLTAMAMSDITNWMAIGSYGLIALLGAWLATRKLIGRGHSHDHHHHHHDHGEHCDHHVVRPEQASGDWRAALGVIVSVGLRPCSGALVVMVFALTQDLLAAGIFATLLMGLGTAITVAVLASLAVGAKGLAVRLGGDGATAVSILWWLELAAALAVMSFGLLLLFASL